MRRPPPVFIALVLLSACSRGGDKTTNVGPGSRPAASGDARAAPAQIAYSYEYRFMVPAANIAAGQDRHVAMCDRIGLARCRVLEIHRAVGDYSAGSLKLEVASGIARRFTAGLAGPVEALGGSLTSSDVEAEDIGRQIVDMTARLHAKEVLVTRLEQALERRAGSTADLVATEKAVADAQGELDAARSELTLAQGRIDASPLLIDYNGQPSFSGRIGEAFGAVKDTFTSSVVALIYFLSAAVPWLLVAGLAFYLWRTLRKRARRGS